MCMTSFSSPLYPRCTQTNLVLSFQHSVILFIMSETPIGQMRIYELRMKLKELGLSPSGTKGDLIARLSQHLEEMKKKQQETNEKQEETKVENAKEDSREYQADITT